MGVEWGGANPRPPKKSTPKPDRFDRLLAAASHLPEITPETAVEPNPQSAESAGELSTKQVVEIIASQPKPPGSGGRRLN